ncbi:LexA family protein [Natronincola ferrireducens]|uniref:LexA DNA binding domain-containing protein n=1 Tax=Natronincola ferrireducens TaxID=393762 RepID=A0A1G9I7V5_9FIRM|nr:winged helix DNA-binding protein [Natronincola ferrireducens]SDL21182.1 LexA DNA binding domain-containing protein [Natronincola ferrireducens]
MISNKQLQILKAISEYIKANEISPTIREICKLVNLKSTATVSSHLVTLQKLGYIEKIQASPRAIRLTDDGKQTIAYQS